MQPYIHTLKHRSLGCSNIQNQRAPRQTRRRRRRCTGTSSWIQRRRTSSFFFAVSTGVLFAFLLLGSSCVSVRAQQQQGEDVQTNVVMDQNEDAVNSNSDHMEGEATIPPTRRETDEQKKHGGASDQEETRSVRENEPMEESSSTESISELSVDEAVSRTPPLPSDDKEKTDGHSSPPLEAEIVSRPESNSANDVPQNVGVPISSSMEENDEGKQAAQDETDRAPGQGSVAQYDTPEDQEYSEPVVEEDIDVQPDIEESSTSSEPDYGQQAIPQPPNREQFEEPVVDAAKVILENRADDSVDEPDATPTLDSNSIEQTIPLPEPEPPTPVQYDDPFVTEYSDDPSSNQNRSESENSATHTKQEDSAKAKTKDVAEGLVEENKENEAQSSVLDNRPLNTIPISQTKGGAMDSEMDFNDKYSMPVCGIWGDYSFAQRRSADISILYKLFRDVEEDAAWLKSSSTSSQQRQAVQQQAEQARDDSSPSSIDNPPLQEDAPLSKTESTETPATATDANRGSSPSAKSNEFVAGLEDIDDLFEGIDAPDELDVGSDGSSFQEVLMGSATRVIIKRITIGAKFAKEKIVSLTKNLTDRLRDENGELKPLQHFRNEDGAFAPFEKLRNEDGNFAPLRGLRNNNGDFAPLRKLRDDDGELRMPSKEQVLDTAKRVQASTVRMGRKISDFFDRLFQGEVADEKFDFSFVPNQEMGD